MRKIIGYILDNRDYFIFLIIIIISILLITNNDSQNIQTIKSKFGFVNYYINLPKSFYNNILSLKEKNKFLNERIVDLNLKNSELRYLISENQKLKSLLEYKDNSKLSLMTSRVINFGVSPFLNSVNIDLGSNNSIVPNLPVIDQNGVIGKTISSYSKTSTVQLMIDYNFRLSVKLEKSGTVGILRYKKDNLFEIWEIPLATEISTNERVLTSGFSDIFPPNLFVGKIVSIINKPNMIQKVAIMQSNINFSKLEYLFLIKEKNR